MNYEWLYFWIFGAHKKTLTKLFLNAMVNFLIIIFLKMKNTTNTLNKLTKLLAVAIISVSLNAFGVMMGPNITISTNHVNATAGTAITPVTISNRGDDVSYYLISPAISNGLSFNEETGVISGTPIVASNPVTYFVTAVNFFTEDTVTVVIAVGVGDINLAFGKHATQSGTYLYYDIIPVAGYAVDGNTDGYFLNKSTTHTKYEQGAWWQVDLGGKKNINEIIIHNRTDCCANRLSNYQVSISDKADFSTHTYQTHFVFEVYVCYRTCCRCVFSCRNVICHTDKEYIEE